MSEAERFFQTPASGEVGASPSKKTKMIPPSQIKLSASAKKAAKQTGKSVLKPIAKDPTGVSAPSIYRKTLPGFNLAGRPGRLKDSDGNGIKALTKKVSRPVSMSTINTDSEWTFRIQSNKNEFIRFFTNSLTVAMYSTYANTQIVQASALAERRALRHSTQSQTGHPKIWFDPTLQGTSLIKSVRVTINGVPVQSNNFLDPHLLHYVRCARIFNSKPDLILARQDQMAYVIDNKAALSPVMKLATKAFEHIDWEKDRSNRVPIYLDGIFPFDFRNRTIESIDEDPEAPLYLPPDSKIEIVVELHRSKTFGVFHDKCNDWGEISGTTAIADAPTFAITFRDVLLEYESCELSKKEHDEVIKQYRSGHEGKYDYDIVRSQNQVLDPGVAYCIKWFQIMPHCRLIYLLFLKGSSIFPQPNSRRPLNAFSMFPVNCSNIKLAFAGEENLITENLENFGYYDSHADISKKMFYDYLTSKRMYVGPFEDFFSNEADQASIIQIFPLDLKHLDSPKTERLTLELFFSKGQNSPTDVQILCLSVHPNGRAICSADKGVNDWTWDFNIL